MRALPLVAVIVAAAVLAPAVTAKSGDPVNPPPSQKTFVQFENPRLALPGELVDVEVLFDPQGGSTDKAVPWEHHRNTDGDKPSLEFTSGRPHSLNVTLMFDGYESKTNVYSMLGELQKFIATPDERHRPPMVLFQWGSTSFQGVIDTMTAKYTLFLDDGTPVRATATVHLVEADHATRGHESGGNQTQA